MFPNEWKRMVAAPEPAPSSGPGGAPPAQPAGGVSGPATPAGDGSPFPRMFAPQPSAPAGADDELDTAIREDREGRGIPHERVKQMRTSWEKKAEERAMQQARQQFMADFGPVLEELQSLRERASQLDPDAVRVGVAKSILKGLGVEEEKPAPRHVTAEEYAKGLKEIETKFRREAQYREELSRANADLQSAKQKYAKTFEHFPVIEELAAAIWGTPYAVKNNVSMGMIVDRLVKQIEDGMGKANEAYVASKLDQARETPILPGGGPKPAKRSEKIDHSPEATAARALEFLEKNAG